MCMNIPVHERALYEIIEYLNVNSVNLQDKRYTLAE